MKEIWKILMDNEFKCWENRWEYIVFYYKLFVVLWIMWLFFLEVFLCDIILWWSLGIFIVKELYFMFLYICDIERILDEIWLRLKV